MRSQNMRAIWQVGDQIQGRWEIFKILQGGAGIVYIVYDHAFRESFAAKTFRDEIFACDPQIGDRFMREALAWVRLDVHPNVTQARMLETIGGKPFLFLEYVNGGDLGSWIGTPRLTEDLPQLLRFAIQLCDGMSHALSKGISAHRDIKPRNCLITGEGTLKVTDFGLAKLLEAELPFADPQFATEPRNFNLTKIAVGTCTHMAPEQFENIELVDARADIYSFGVMLYQMVTANLPFVGDNWKELEHLHKTMPAPHLGQINPGLANVIRTCLEKKPSNRFSSFVQLRERLAAIYQETTGVKPLEPVRGTLLNAVQSNNKGSSLGHLGHHAEAIACYDLALKLNPSLASAWFNKGVALSALKRHEEALNCYEEALRINPKSEHAWSNRGVALKSMGKTEEALRCYDRALHLNPRYPNAWINKGVACKSLGKTAEALECYERALRLDPRDASGWTNKGNAFYALGRLEEALACYESALSINSNLDLAWLNKGIALAAMHRYQDALACYGTAIELNPRQGQAWFLRGMTLVNGFRDYRDALPYFEEAERQGSKEATNAIAMCRQAVGQSQGR